MAQEAGLSKEQLKEFSKEHLYYEIDMLYGTARLLQHPKTKEHYYLNATLESFIVHASVILDFFYKLPLNPREAKAIHYVRDVQKWKEVMPPFDRYFMKFNKKRNREVMHLSYERLEVAPYDKKWNSPQLLKQFEGLINLFLEHADPQLVHPKLYTCKSR